MTSRGLLPSHSQDPLSEWGDKFGELGRLQMSIIRLLVGSYIHKVAGVVIITVGINYYLCLCIAL